MDEGLADALVDYVRNCCVQIRGATNGTGYFIAPTLVISCAHVVGRSQSKGSSVAARVWSEVAPFDLTVLEVWPEEDLVLLKAQREHPAYCALGTGCTIGDVLVGFGIHKFENYERFEPFRARYEGLSEWRTTTGGVPITKGKMSTALILSGFSGGPVLSLSTNRVLGTVVATRSDKFANGGWFIPSSSILQRVSDLGFALPPPSAVWVQAKSPNEKELDRWAKRSADFTAKISAFLDFHLGSPAAFPFPDKSAAIEDLNAWILDPERQYCVVAAGQARGKSYLAAKWTTSERAQSLADFIVVPLSGSNKGLFTTPREVHEYLIVELNGRLQRYDFELHASDTDGAVRRHLANLLQVYASKADGLLVVVLDGVDEALHGDWLADLHTPLVASSRLKLCAFARDHANRAAVTWIHELGWPIQRSSLISLSRFNQLELKASIPTEVLKKARLEDQAVCNRVLERADDAPFLLRLYLDQLLWRASNQPQSNLVAVLEQADVDTNDELDRFLQAQYRVFGDDEILEDVLIVLAWANYPLLISDIQRLLSHAPHPAVLRRCIDSLSRLLLGSAERGYMIGLEVLRNRIASSITNEQELFAQLLTYAQEVARSERQLPTKALISLIVTKIKGSSIRADWLLSFRDPKWQRASEGDQYRHLLRLALNEASEKVVDSSVPALEALTEHFGISLLLASIGPHPAPAAMAADIYSTAGRIHTAKWSFTDSQAAATLINCVPQFLQSDLGNGLWMTFAC